MVWGALGLALVCLAAPRRPAARSSAMPLAMGDVRPVVYQSADEPRTVAKRIEEIRVGQRVPAKNPTGEFDRSLGEEVDPATWRRLELRAPKRDGSYADVVLLRPQGWLEQRAAEVGGHVFISVPECGIDGNAELLAIGPCPAIPAGDGRVVIGTFKHQSAAVIDVSVEGLSEPIGVTINHPFWSDDRQEFVRADELHVGERLHGLTGSPRITAISPRGPPEPVYNLEIHGEHCYQVSSLGLIVHNSTGLLCPDGFVPLEDLADSARRLNAPATKPLRRPYIRKGTRAEVEARAPRTADGRPIDPNTLQPIEGKPDLGHKTGNEFWREKAKAEAEGLTQKEFNDRINSPDLYQLEDPISNRSHRYELPR